MLRECFWRKTEISILKILLHSLPKSSPQFFIKLIKYSIIERDFKTALENVVVILNSFSAVLSECVLRKTQIFKLKVDFI